MIYFHKWPHGARLSGQSVVVEKGSTTIGLSGYLDQLGIRVVAPLGLATVTMGRVAGQSCEWHVSPLVCGKVRVEARTVIGSVLDWVEILFLTHGGHVAMLRHAVVAEARQHVGAHYIWGGAGAEPGGHQGMPGRPNSVHRVADRLDVKHVCLRAASCAVDDLHVCGGRYKEVGGRVLHTKEDFAALTSYLDGLRGKPPAQWQPMENGLWPRLMQGKTVGRHVVLGESCDGVRHFDCVGFVNFCYSAATRRSVQNSIKGWIRETREVTNHSDEPGDILTVGDHHIGLATGDGHALQAAQASRGVILTPLRHSGWDRRGRYFH